MNILCLYLYFFVFDKNLCSGDMIISYEKGRCSMEDDQIRKIREAKETIKGLDKAALMEVLFHIDELVKNYEDRHKA